MVSTVEVVFYREDVKVVMFNSRSKTLPIVRRWSVEIVGQKAERRSQILEPIT